MRRPWRLDPVATTLGLLHDGELDVVEHQDALAAVLGERWPDRTTYLCAVRQRDLRRVVFGRDLWPAPAAAVAASCAVPGYFGAVVVDGEPYVDGGVHSPTNATVLADLDLDLVIVSSPMSATHPARSASPAGRDGTRARSCGERCGCCETEASRPSWSSRARSSPSSWAWT